VTSSALTALPGRPLRLMLTPVRNKFGGDASLPIPDGQDLHTGMGRAMQICSHVFNSAHIRLIITMG
jgi:hypothetical protein